MTRRWDSTSIMYQPRDQVAGLGQRTAVVTGAASWLR